MGEGDASRSAGASVCWLTIARRYLQCARRLDIRRPMTLILRQRSKLNARGRSQTSRETSPFRPRHVNTVPPCTLACPIRNDIRAAMRVIANRINAGGTHQDMVRQAWHTFVETSPFPAVCGRVCPRLCEVECSRAELEGAVSIGSLERAIGDRAIELGFELPMPPVSQTHSKPVAVIGAGPAGLSCAYQLVRLGCAVTVFERSGNAGGMLRYGIPRFRLPRTVLDAEIARIIALGVRIEYNTTVGRDLPFDALLQDYAAVFVAIGAQEGRSLGIPGENGAGVWSATALLRAMELDEKVDIGDKAVIVGGGNAAIDAARICRRVGSDVTIVYHRSLAEMPAIRSEFERAKEEGVVFEFLVKPIEIARENQRMAVLCQRTELGECDVSGRRRPIPIEAEYLQLDCSTLVVAIGQRVDSAGFSGCLRGQNGFLAKGGCWSPMVGVYAGGDAVVPGLVAAAIAQGSQAARSIHEDLLRPASTMSHAAHPLEPAFSKQKLNHGWYGRTERTRHLEAVEVRARLEHPDLEVECGCTWDNAAFESKRCMSCGLCFDCGHCWSLCSDGAIVRAPIAGDPCSFNLAFCQGCGKCWEHCPCGCVEKG